jgi:2-polyprenyl-3-methyl-5-hydroxy-6-metoxy-1,4-benzoquinol methylase
MSLSISYADMLKKNINSNSIITKPTDLTKSSNITKPLNPDKSFYPAKLPLDEDYIYDKFIGSKVKQNKITIINTLVRKLLKSNKLDPSYSDIVKYISKIIFNTDDNINNISGAIYNINKILSESKYKTLCENNPNHSYVADNLSNILKLSGFNSDIKILDIGGGEGDVIKKIGSNMGINNNNLYSLEELDSSWVEKYNFSNDINYIYWDNVSISLNTNTLNTHTDTKSYFDVIICMVSLHHMNNETIQNLILNINHLLKKDGLIILKEHDADSRDTMRIIDWEHHLYHILRSPDNMDMDTIDEYLNNFINNYKSKLGFDELFLSNGYVEISELNRNFTKFVEYDDANITKLYWKIYKKL